MRKVNAAHVSRDSALIERVLVGNTEAMK